MHLENCENTAEAAEDAAEDACADTVYIDVVEDTSITASVDTVLLMLVLLKIVLVQQVYYNRAADNTTDFVKGKSEKDQIEILMRVLKKKLAIKDKIMDNSSKLSTGKKTNRTCHKTVLGVVGMLIALNQL